MRKKIVAGNWKMNMNLQEGIALAKELNEMLVNDRPNCEVVICTPFIHLASVAQLVDENVIKESLTIIEYEKNNDSIHQKEIMKCNMCVHRSEDGKTPMPMCVEKCPMHAITLEEVKE